jgi:hypothetical protein
MKALIALCLGLSTAIWAAEERMVVNAASGSASESWST